MGTRKLIVEVVGDSRSLERSFSRSSKAAAKFGTETTSSVGKVEAGFGRLQRIAAGGFIGGTALLAARRFVDLASESQQVLGQTQVALRAAGLSWQQYAGQIQDTIAAQTKLGFDDEALLQTFSLFVRQTDNVGEALSRNNLAMDIARARFIDLGQAAQIVNKAALGQAGALRRLGIDVKTGASAFELLTKLQQEFGGAAVAASDDAATAMDRLQVQSENLQESLGTLALPVVQNLADILGKASDAATRLSDSLGGLQTNSDHISLGDFLTGSIADIPKIFEKSLKPPWDWKPVAESQADALVKAMHDAIDNRVTQTPAGLQGPVSGFGDQITGAISKAFEVARKQVDAAIAKGQAATTKAAAEKARQGQRDAFQNLLSAIGLGVDKAAATKGFADDLAQNTKLQTAIKRQIAVEGKTTELERDLFEAQTARAQILTDQANGVKEARRRANAAIQAAQFQALGLTASGDQRVPTVGNLSKQVEQLLGRTDVTSKIEGQLDRIGKVLKGKFGKVTEDTRRVVKGLVDGIRDELNKGGDTLAKGPLTKTSSLNANRILAGLGLDPDAERALRARLSTINTAGRGLPGSGTSPSGFFGGRAIQVTVVSTLDGEVVSRNTTKHQQKTARRNPKNKRGGF